MATKTNTRKRSRTLAERRKQVRTETRLLRTSERSTFKTCRWRWWMSYERALKPHVETAPALVLGTLVHQALAEYYVPGIRRGPKPAETFEKLYKKFTAKATKMGFYDEDGVYQELGELGVSMLEHYVEHYGRDERYKVLVTEQPFQQRVWVSEKQDVIAFTYTGVLDGIWLDREVDKLLMVDHKTTDSIVTKYLAQDDQAGSYWTWGQDWIYEQGLLKPDQKLNGMMFNFLRKAKPDQRPRNQAGQFLNKDGSISKVQPPDYFKRAPVWRGEDERENQRVRAMAEAQEMDMVRSGVLSVLKTPSKINCTTCPVADACELHETGGDWEEFVSLTMKKWDPYEAHETYVAETAR